MFNWRSCLVLLVLVVCAPVHAASARLPLWEATGPQGTVYLFGSVHVCKASCFPLPKAALRRLDASKALVVELDPQRPEVMDKMLEAAMLPAGERLSTQLSPERWKGVVNASMKLGLPSEVLEPMRPWMADVMLGLRVAERGGYDVVHGIDVNLMKRASEHGMALEELETVDGQIAALSAATPDEQHAALEGTVTQIRNGRAVRYLDELVAAWKTGDMNAMQKLLRENLPAESTQSQALVERRNAAMSSKIADSMADGRTRFVVVGVAHMVGAEGIPAQLQRRGYKVRQLSVED